MKEKHSRGDDLALILAVIVILIVVGFLLFGDPH